MSNTDAHNSDKTTTSSLESSKISKMPGLDLITVGRSSVDLYGQQIGGRLEDMASFAKYVGGSPTNTAIGAQRLGLRTGLISGVGDDHMGRFILETLEAEGVDISAVRRDPQRLTALVILGILDKDTFPLIFYRENCADMALGPEDINLDWLRSSKAVLINGTHLSRDNVYAMSCLAAETVKAAGGKVIFDIDYRPVLWGLTKKDQGENRFVLAGEVTEKLRTVAPLCDLIIGTEEEIRILGGAEDLTEALRNVRAASAAVIVCKAGPEGCFIYSGATERGQALHVPGFAVEVLNVLGAGDAFAAGFVSGWLRGANLAACGRRGNAAGALVVSRHGCAPAMPTEAELDLFMNAGAWPVSEALRLMLDNLNWAQRRPRHYKALKVLAIDHRIQLEELADVQGADAARIPRFKQLALQAVDSVADGDGSFGILLDGRLGGGALMEAAAYPYWIGRPIELPKSRPIEFEGSPDVGMEIATWPLNHVVKCLVSYHPDDAEPMRRLQEEQLLRLQDACRKTDHELLLEVIPPADMPMDNTTISRVLERFYALGIRPDWWKLESQKEKAGWQHVQAVIDAHDPNCRGVLILGLNAPESELIKAFEVAAGFDCIKGFAVGRTIFQDVAAAWLADMLDDAGAVAELSRRFTNLVEAWTLVRRGEERAA
ncbi:bifunctional 5-dehydro-2-deoxygluconokinase/5-dehydro-2-deoxyphosphogluconate aldolase [Asticcacaulis sp. 201]|uniref:bifunctional 5-dehydro-2-deoxygluconokinase/5-dehydro-2- deoxyphosphogluconate aldolase n=1 Tax=Asticcacaulis sp. 201 TaxID=3028787 RepID=UPI002915C6F4|nr:5-dehydro-2-deoxygluconokinase [Asticcacaulis sp. 201]MDV6331210.1 5-dehydro-2-deoxygluconokinase [Asticcacaulis sp. 201]